MWFCRYPLQGVVLWYGLNSLPSTRVEGLIPSYPFQCLSKGYENYVIQNLGEMDSEILESRGSNTL